MHKHKYIHTNRYSTLHRCGWQQSICNSERVSRHNIVRTNFCTYNSVVCFVHTGNVRSRPPSLLLHTIAEGDLYSAEAISIHLMLDKLDTGSCEDDLEWEEWNPAKISFVHHMIAGSVAGLVEHISIYPIDTMKTHIQYEKSASFRPLHSLKSLMSGEGGFFRLWRGVSAMFAGCIPAHSAYFAVFEASKTILGADQEGHHPFQAAACGVLAAISHDSFLTPFDVVKQRMQLGYYKSVTHCISTILKTEGMRALYASFPTTLMMNVPFGAVMVSVNESMKKILNPDETYNFWTTMLSGSIAGSIAAAATNPLDVVKTRLQTQNLEHCTKSCEDPLFNPTTPTAGTPSAGAAAPGVANSSSNAGGSASARPNRDGAGAKSYRRRPGATLIPQMQMGVVNSTGVSSAGARSKPFATMKDGLYGRSKSGKSGVGVGISSGAAAAVGSGHGDVRSGRWAGSSAYYTSARVPNFRTRALMTVSQARPPRHPLGYFKPQQSGCGLMFTISPSAVMRAFGSAGPQQGALPSSATIQTLGMVDIAKKIYSSEGLRGFSRGIIARMLVQAPSVAISWTAYETVKCMLVQD